MRNIGIVDADLLDKGTRHPNLVCLKLAGHYKKHGENVELIEQWSEIKDNAEKYDHIFIVRVFDFTKIPLGILELPNVSYGGTGFKACFLSYPLEGNPVPAEKVEQHGIILTLPDEIEHTMPDYHLYDKFVAHEIARGIKPIKYSDYMDFSIGFTTRGCFRNCAFCVNECSQGVKFHAHVKEFFDPTRKMIYLWGR